MSSFIITDAKVARSTKELSHEELTIVHAAFEMQKEEIESLKEQISDTEAIIKEACPSSTIAMTKYYFKKWGKIAKSN